MFTVVTPYTRTEALQHILKELDAGNLGAASEDTCAYEMADNNGHIKHCAVGCLFTPAQHKWIQDNKLSYRTVDLVAVYTTKESLESQTGLSLTEMIKLQKLHDEGAESGDWRPLRKYVDGLLKGRLTGFFQLL